MSYRKTKKLALTDAAYLAGLIDGEGTITLSRINRNKYRALVVTVSNTEMDILQYVQAVTGVGKITNKRSVKSTHAPSFTYQVSNRQALGILGQIVEYLRSHKAARAHLALEDYLLLTPRNGRYSTEQLEKRELFIERFFGIRPVTQATLN